MAGIIQCPCGQKLKVNIPPAGARVKCPKCSRLLQLKSAGTTTQPAPQSATQLPAAPPHPVAQPVQPKPALPAADPFGNLPATPNPHFSSGPSNSNTAPAANPYARQSTPHSRRGKSKLSRGKKGAGKRVLVMAGSFVGVIALIAIGSLAVRSGIAAIGRLQSTESRSTGPPVTKAEALTVATDFEREMQKGATTNSDKVIDWKELIELAIIGTDLPDSQKTLVTGSVLNATRGARWTNRIATEFNRNIKLLRVRSQNGQQTALFRGLGPEGGLNYFEFSFHRTKAGVKVSDIYQFMIGEKMSETMRRAIFPIIAHQNRSFIQKLSGKQSDFVTHGPAVERINMLAQSAPKAALDNYRKLPASLRADKTMMITRIGIASRLNDKQEYKAAVNDLVEKFPNDAATNLHLIDYYALQNDFDGTVRAIDKLNAVVGGDPELDLMKAYALLQQGQNEQAKTIIQNVIAQDPSHAIAKAVLANLP